MVDRPIKRGDRYKLFAREYITDLNGTRAAIAAGYKPGAAAVTACNLLTQDKVKKLLAALLQKRNESLDITAERVLGELGKLGYSNIMDFMRVNPETGFADFDLTNMTRDQAAAIQELTVDSTGGTGDGEIKLVLRNKLKLAAKTPALELLGKYLKLFVDQVQVTGLEGLAEAIAGRRKGRQA